MGDAELSVAWGEDGPRARLFAKMILNYEMHGTGARPMISLRFTSLSRYMPIMDFESVAAITFFLNPRAGGEEGEYSRHGLGTMSTIRKL